MEYHHKSLSLSSLSSDSSSDEKKPSKTFYQAENLGASLPFNSAAVYDSKRYSDSNEPSLLKHSTQYSASFSLNTEEERKGSPPPPRKYGRISGYSKRSSHKHMHKHSSAVLYPHHKYFTASPVSDISPRWDPESLYKDDEDRERLGLMKEFEREAELARRHEEHIRAKQRQQLFKEDSKREAIPYSGARRLKRRQNVRSYKPNKRPSQRERVLSPMSASEISSESLQTDEDDGIYQDNSPIETASSSEEISVEKARVKSTKFTDSKETRATDERSQQLFIDERKDEEVDVIRSKGICNQIVDELSLETIKSLRLNLDTLLHILEHPKNEKYLVGCFVKAIPQGSHTNEASPQIFNIVGLEEREPYHLPNEKLCSHNLIVNVVPFNCSNGTELVELKDVVNSAITPDEFREWQKLLYNVYPFDEDIEEKLKDKIQELKLFTFTDEDVESILNRNIQLASANSARSDAGIVTSSALVKEKMAVQHEIDSLLMSQAAASVIDEQEQLAYNTKLANLNSKKSQLEMQINDYKKKAAVLDKHQMAMDKVKMRRSRLLSKDAANGTAPHKSTAEAHHQFVHRHCQPTVLWDFDINMKNSGVKMSQPVGASESRPHAYINVDTLDEHRNTLTDVTTPLTSHTLQNHPNAEAPNLATILKSSTENQNNYIRRALMANKDYRILENIEKSASERPVSVLTNIGEWMDSVMNNKDAATAIADSVNSAFLTLDEYTNMTRIAMASMQMNANSY